MKKGDLITIEFFGNTVKAHILQITNKWVKFIFEGNTYKASINKIKK